MTNSPFEHIVVLMMENQSFDRVFGFLKGTEKLTGDEFYYNLNKSDISSLQVFNKQDVIKK